MKAIKVGDKVRIPDGDGTIATVEGISGYAKELLDLSWADGHVNTFVHIADVVKVA